jgi:hypothetical protein
MPPGHCRVAQPYAKHSHTVGTHRAFATPSSHVHTQRSPMYLPIQGRSPAHLHANRSISFPPFLRDNGTLDINNSHDKACDTPTPLNTTPPTDKYIHLSTYRPGHLRDRDHTTDTFTPSSPNRDHCSGCRGSETATARTRHITSVRCPKHQTPVT